MTRRSLKIVAVLVLLAGLAAAAWMARIPIALAMVERMAEGCQPVAAV